MKFHLTVPMTLLILTPVHSIAGGQDPNPRKSIDQGDVADHDVLDRTLPDIRSEIVPHGQIIGIEVVRAQGNRIISGVGISPSRCSGT